MFKCLVANRFSQSSLLKLKNQSHLQVHHSDLLGELREHWEACEGLIIRSRSKIDQDMLKKLPNLKVIITATSGFDHIDLKSCGEKNITVMHTPLANVQSAAELTFSLLLATQRKLIQANQQVHKENWQRDNLVGRELCQQKLGIIGFGRIGKKVYNIAKSFGMDVMIHDPYVEQKGYEDLPFLGFEEVIRHSDIVSFHVPLTSETRHMIKASTLDWFHDSATLINTSRGDVVCLNSLIQYLSENPLFSVGLDVFPNEPITKSSPLLNFNNVTTTPHIGATTQEALERASMMAVDKLISYVEKGSISDILPPQALWADKII